jgi:hypothetical protein
VRVRDELATCDRPTLRTNLAQLRQHERDGRIFGVWTKPGLVPAARSARPHRTIAIRLREGRGSILD